MLLPLVRVCGNISRKTYGLWIISIRLLPSVICIDCSLLPEWGQKLLQFAYLCHRGEADHLAERICATTQERL